MTRITLKQSLAYNMSVDEERTALIAGVRECFGIDLRRRTPFPTDPRRAEVSAHLFYREWPDDEISDEEKRAVREWIEDRNWQFSRQHRRLQVQGLENRAVEDVFLAPMRFLELLVAYHVTPLSRVSAIERQGLLPNWGHSLAIDGRMDCEGNIYVCEELGKAGESGVPPDAHSAHWWQSHFAKERWHGEEVWAILKTDLDGLCGVKCYRDMWSESGIIVSGVSVIPPCRIKPID